MYPLVVYKTLKIKIGPLISYGKTITEEQGISLGWIRSLSVKYLGLGVLSDMQINYLFRTPLSLHLFVSPEYLFRLKSETNGGSMSRNYDKDLEVLNVQLGISYLVK